MGVRHRELAVEGVQFHPESILTPQGPRLLGNFLERGEPIRCPPRVTSSPLARAARPDPTRGRGVARRSGGPGDLCRPCRCGARARCAPRGAVADEVRGFAQAMRRLARRPSIPAGCRAVDVVGTGGDAPAASTSPPAPRSSPPPAACRWSSTATGRSRAAQAAPMCSRRSGLALPLDEAMRRRCLAACDFTFLFAPHYHPATKAVAPVRAALGVRTDIQHPRAARPIPRSRRFT